MTTLTIITQETIPETTDEKSMAVASRTTVPRTLPDTPSPSILTRLLDRALSPVRPLGQALGALHLATRAAHLRAKANFRQDALDVTLTDRHVVLTGVTSTIGYELAETLLALGANLHLLVRDTQRGQHCRRSLMHSTGVTDSDRITVHLCDLSNLTSIDHCVENLINGNNDSRCDILVHCAHVHPLHLQQGSATDDGLDPVVAVNTLAVHHLTSRLLSHLRTSNDGRVLLVTRPNANHVSSIPPARYTTNSRQIDLPLWPQRQEKSRQEQYEATQQQQMALVRHYASQETGNVLFACVWPGWHDTPTQRLVTHPEQSAWSDALARRWRSPEEACDTLTWWAASNEVRDLSQNGKCWLDRQVLQTDSWPFAASVAVTPATIQLSDARLVEGLDRCVEALLEELD